MQYKVGDKLICFNDKVMVHPIKNGEKYTIVSIDQNYIWINVVGAKLSIDITEVNWYWKPDIKKIRKEKLIKLNERI